MAISIGHLAKKSGVSVAAIRYYQSLGLLPGAARLGNGHRDFNPQNLESLLLIKSLRDTGMSLKEVRIFLGVRHDKAATCAKLASLAHQRATIIRQKILSLRQAEERLKAFASTCNEACRNVSAGNCGNLSLLNPA